MNTRLLILLVSILGFLGCNKEEALNPEEYDWLIEESNFKDSLYESKYENAYEKYMGQKDYNAAGLMLDAKGKALDYHFQFDSVYLDRSIRFIEQHTNEIEDSINLDLRYYIGSQLDFNREVEKSEKWLLGMMDFSENPKKQRLIGFANIILAQQKSGANEIKKAQEYALEANSIFETIKDTANMSTIQMTIHNLAKKMNDDRQAVSAMNKMLQLGIAVKDTYNICNAYINYAFHSTKLDPSYGQLALYFDTLDHYVRNWSSPSERVIFMHTYINSFAKIYNNELEEAKKLIEECESMIGGSKFFSFEMENLKYRYALKKDGVVNEEQLNSILSKQLEDKNYYRAVNTLKNAVMVKEKNKDFVGAYGYLSKSIEYRDSLWDKDLKAQIYEYKEKYQAAKKEKEILKQKQIIAKRNNTILFLGLGLLSAFLSFLIYTGFRKRKSVEKEKILQEQFTSDLLQNTEIERARIAGDLHDSVNHQLLQMSNKSASGDKIEATEIKSVMESIRTISHDLYPVMFEQVGLELSIKDLCQKVMEKSTLKISSTIDYDKKLGVKQELQIFRIIQEAINNILKHSKATHAFVKIVSKESNLEVSINDNGQGFLIGNQKKPTFGLANIEQRAKSIKGKIKITSGKEGTLLKLDVNA